MHPPLFAIILGFFGWRLWSAEHWLDFGFEAQDTLDALTQALEQHDEAGLKALLHPRFSGQAPDPKGSDWLDIGDANEAAEAWMAYVEQFGPKPWIRLFAHTYQSPPCAGRLAVTVFMEAEGEQHLHRARAIVQLQKKGSKLLLKGWRFEGSMNTQDYRPRFVDVATKRGLVWSAGASQRMGGFAGMGSGVDGGGGISGGDFDGDGDIDLILLGASVNLFEAVGDGFYRERPIELEQPDLVNATGATVVDYNNDGLLDLLLTHQQGPRGAQLYRATGPFAWTKATEESGLVLPANHYTIGSVWGDYDRDGDLDCYALGFGDLNGDPPDFIMNARNGRRNLLFANDGQGRFTDQTDEAGVGDTGFTLSGLFTDINDDGWLDLYSVNDYGSNRLFLNPGSTGGRWQDATWSLGVYDYGAGMGVDFGDVDGDGDGDLYTSNIAIRNLWFYDNNLLGWLTWRTFLSKEIRTPLFLSREQMRDRLGVGTRTAGVWFADGNSLMLQDSDGNFRNVAGEQGVWNGGWSWGNRLADIDNDGDLDIVVANGFMSRAKRRDVYGPHIKMALKYPERFRAGEFYTEGFLEGRSWHGWERSRIFVNDGEAHFDERGYGLGISGREDGRALAVLDIDMDGDLDLMESTVGWDHNPKPPFKLYQNNFEADNSWLSVQLVGTSSDRQALGAKLRIITDKGSITTWNNSGGSYLTSIVAPLHIGLGEATEINKIEVRWPSGKEQVFDGVLVRTRVRLVEASR